MTAREINASSPVLRGRTAVLVMGAVILFVLALGTETAVAFWTSSGHGTGTAATGTAQNVTISTNAIAATPLQPDNSAADMVITATNPNAYAVNITALTLGAVTGCGTPAVSLVTPATSYLPIAIPANANNQRIVIHNALTMGPGATNDCQGASLTIPLTATVTK